MYLDNPHWAADAAFSIQPRTGPSLPVNKILRAYLQRTQRAGLWSGTESTAEFSSEGSYENTFERLLVTMVKKEKCPFFVKLSGRELPHFLDRSKFLKAQEGWYYSQTSRAVEIRSDYPAEDFSLQVSFEEMDLIGM